MAIACGEHTFNLLVNYTGINVSPLRRALCRFIFDGFTFPSRELSLSQTPSPSGASNERAAGPSERSMREKSSFARAGMGLWALIGFLGGGAAASMLACFEVALEWGTIDQFLPTLGRKMSFLAYLVSAYALAVSVLSAGVFAGAFHLWHHTRFGRWSREGWVAHARARAEDPSRALGGLSMILAALPVVGVLMAVELATLSSRLANRKHLGLVIAVVMVSTVAALVAAVPLSFSLARLIEAGLRPLCRRSARFARALSSPWAPAVALLGVALIGALVVGIRTRHLIEVLPLWPLWSMLIVLGLLGVMTWGLTRFVAPWLSRRHLGLRMAIAPAMCLSLIATLYPVGDADDVIKSAVAYSAFGGSLTKLYRKVADNDGDGFSSVLAGGDCDDSDAEVHPGAFDTPNDGVDQNCAGGDVKFRHHFEEVAFVELLEPLPEELNVLLITIDTVRADHFSAYGYERKTTPVMDAIAREGTLFQNAWAHAPSTRYSMPAILTGRYPLAVFYDYSVWWPALQTRNYTIAEMLKSAGLYTGAILNYSYFAKVRRMNQGYDQYDNSNARLHAPTGKEGPAKTRGSSSKQQTDRAIKFVKKHGQEPFHLWVHYYDPHYQYEHHEGVEQYGEEDIDRYDEEIRFTDQQIGRLIDHLKEEKVYEKTVIVITGDHGEGFGEHGVDLHGFHLYAAQTKVPLIIRVPGLEPQKVTMPVSHVDVLPTLANIVGEPPRDEMQGRSLLDVMSGQSKAGRDRVVFQQLSFGNGKGRTEIRAAASARCHIIYNVQPHTSWELYNIAHDPMEKHDIIGNPGECGSMREKIEAWYDWSEIPSDFYSSLLAERPKIESPLNIDIGDGIRLLDVEMPEGPLKRGEAFSITWTFEVRGDVPDHWKFFVHFNSPKGRVFSADHEPARPFNLWKEGDFIRYSQEVTVPERNPPGEYTVRMGLFYKGDRAPIKAERSDIDVKENRVLVGDFKVVR